MFNFIKRMITINNKGYVGKSITIINGKVIIDGKDVTPDSKEITISVDGNLDNLEVDHANTIIIKGDVNKVRSGSGDVSCGNITGGTQTGSGDIDCGIITGDVQTGSGDVNATTITGSVRTGSGDIKYKGK
jgi:hypothetical protein